MAIFCPTKKNNGSILMLNIDLSRSITNSSSTCIHFVHITYSCQYHSYFFFAESNLNPLSNMQYFTFETCVCVWAQAYKFQIPMIIAIFVLYKAHSAAIVALISPSFSLSQLTNVQTRALFISKTKSHTSYY